MPGLTTSGTAPAAQPFEKNDSFGDSVKSDDKKSDIVFKDAEKDLELNNHFDSEAKIA